MIDVNQPSLLNLYLIKMKNILSKKVKTMVLIKKSENYGIEIICSIDFYNTGVTKENSVWSDLHQFLEIKKERCLLRNI